MGPFNMFVFVIKFSDWCVLVFGNIKMVCFDLYCMFLFVSCFRIDVIICLGQFRDLSFNTVHTNGIVHSIRVLACISIC